MKCTERDGEGKISLEGLKFKEFLGKEKKRGEKEGEIDLVGKRNGIIAGRLQKGMGEVKYPLKI